MSTVVAYAAAICAAVSAWLVRGALAVESAGPDAAKVGLVPPFWELGLFIVAGACVVVLLRPKADRMLPLFATATCILPWLPGIRSPALLMWTGPLAVAAWCGAVVATLLSGGWRRSIGGRLTIAAFANPRYGSMLAGFLACTFFGLVAFGARGAVPAGDEPHYLIITQSLLYDRDLQIENNHARRDYSAYFHGQLQPDFWRRGQNGAIYSVHAPGLPALVAPAFLVGGYRGVVVFLLLMSAVAAGLLWRLAFVVSGSAAAAWFAVAATAGAAPVAFHTFTVFPDGPAGFIVLTGIWALLRVARLSALVPIGSRGAWVLHGLALAILPWMHVRLAVLAGALAVIILLRMPRNREGLARAAAFLVVPALSAVGWFTFFLVIYGTPSPAAPWTRLAMAWSYIPSGLAGILFDQQFGALPYAPVLLVAAAGWFWMLRTNRRLALEILAVAVPYVIVTTRLWIWWAGWSAPARFWTPLFWVGGITAAVAWNAGRSRLARATATGLLLASTTTTIGLAYAFGGRLAYNPRDGYARWFDWISPLADLPLGLPSFFRTLERPRTFDLQVLLVVGICAVGLLLLRWLDKHVRGDGAFTLILLATVAVCATTAVAAELSMNGGTEPRAATSQLRLLELARNARMPGLRYEGASMGFLSGADLVGSLRIESPPRLRMGSDAPVLLLPGWFPAGTYRVSATVNGGGGHPWEFRVLRAGPAIAQGVESAARLELTVKLPMDTPAFVLRGRGFESAFMQPLHVATWRERFEPARASGARRYGNTTAWFVDGNAFDDPDGIWTKGDAAEARLVLQPDAGAWVAVVLRNGPSANEVSLESGAGDWSWSAAMRPGEEREVRIPVDTVRGAVLLRVVSRRGFRPSETDPGSRDTRLLGVWMSPR